MNLQFRAWDKKEKRMSKPFSFGDLVGYEGEGGSWVMSYPDKDQPADLDITNNGRLCDIELMQYTGKNDNHGKQIYAGYKLKWVDYYNKEHTATVHWLDEFARFDLAEDGSLPLSSVMRQHEVEVIGNIYED